MNNRDKTKQKVLRKRFKAAIKKHRGGRTPDAKHAGAEAQRKLELLDLPAIAPVAPATPVKAAVPAKRVREPKSSGTAAAPTPAA